MSVAPLRVGQEFSFTAPMRAYSYRETHSYSAYDGALHPDTLEVELPGKFKRIVLPEERLIADDLMFMDLFGNWSLTAGVPQIGSLLFCQRLTGKYARFAPNAKNTNFGQAVEVKDVRWPDPTPQALVVHVRVMSRHGAGGNIENYRSRQFSPIYWKECGQLEQLPLEQGVKKAVEMLTGYRYVPDPAAALRERGFDV